MAQDLDKFKKDINWEEKARKNPLFAIMSDDIFKSSGDEPTTEELQLLYAQGEKFWKKWFAPLFWDKTDTKDLSLLEYGCGMGRIINYPAPHFGKCYGIDISETQIEYANKYCPNRADVTFSLLEKPELTIPLKENVVDVVYSYAVLQHIQQRSSLVKAISEMSRVLKKGGKLKVQIRSTHNYLSSGKRSVYKSTVFENYTLAFYTRNISFLPIPVIRLIKHTNWSGAGCFFSVSGFRDLLQDHNVRVDTI
jgi:ubiquinone/menaquinone biosynthesis C-methylase UbiE